jgi:WD40 repeat protein
MPIFKRAIAGACEACRAVLSGVRCLREILLLCGGIAAVLVILGGAVEVDGWQLTTAMQAGAEAKARPDLPIYRIDLVPDENAAWIRRGDSGIDKISLATGQVLDWIPTAGRYVPDAAHSRDGRVHAWSTAPRFLTVTRDSVVLVDELESDTIENVSLTSNGSRAAAIDASGRILIWDLTESPPRRRSLMLEAVPQQVEWSPDGDRLVAGCGNGLVSLLQSDGRTVWARNCDRYSATALAWSPDGACVVVGQQGGDIIALNAEDGALRWRSRQDSIQVSAVTFSPDAERLAVSGFDRSVVVISAVDGRRLQKIPGHYDMVSALQFLPDGDQILSGSLDGTLRIWSASSGRQLRKM